MNEYGHRREGAKVGDLGLNSVAAAYWKLNPEELVEESILLGQGELSDNGAWAVDTGEFTGRSPKDRFVVADDITNDTVWWGDINLKFDADKFDQLYDKVCAYLGGKEVYVRDSYACASEKHRLNIRVVTEYPWSNLFCNNLFLRPTDEEIASFDPEWKIICAPGFIADAEKDGTRQHNFAVLNFTKKTILIGGTAYTGEMKKGIFSVLNYILPQERNVLSMHCSANVGADGDTAIFFGLSGTGKTTLSADPARKLIGDDEHGWDGDSIFNFEGGCYAKCIDLTQEKEPQIWDAIKFGALVENTNFIEGTSTVDYENVEKTQNTRVAYPIHHIDNIMEPSRAGNPENIFFLTCDAFGVLPPISKLTPGQAMYHFISGYTAKIAGTEVGIVDPEQTFSACFGAAFLPLHPTKYAELLGEKMQEHNVNVWLVNTGWSGGAFGTGERMSLKYTRAMITAAMEGKLNEVSFQEHPVFGLAMPETCEGVPTELLNPKDTWADKASYDQTANKLAASFVENFEKYADNANDEIMAAAPKVSAAV